MRRRPLTAPDTDGGRRWRGLEEAPPASDVGAVLANAHERIPPPSFAQQLRQRLQRRRSQELTLLQLRQHQAAWDSCARALQMLQINQACKGAHVHLAPWTAGHLPRRLLPVQRPAIRHATHGTEVEGTLMTIRFTCSAPASGLLLLGLASAWPPPRLSRQHQDASGSVLNCAVLATTVPTDCWRHRPRCRRRRNSHAYHPLICTATPLACPSQRSCRMRAACPWASWRSRWPGRRAAPRPARRAGPPTSPAARAA